MKDFSLKAWAAIEAAKEMASITGGLLGTEHILYGLTTVPNTASNTLAEFGVTSELVTSFFNVRNDYSAVVISVNANSVLNNAAAIAVEVGSSFIGSEHILLAILREGNSFAVRNLIKCGVNLADLLIKATADVYGVAPNNDSFYNGSFSDGSGEDYVEKLKKKLDNRANGGNNAQNEDIGELAKFGVDLTLKAKENKLDPVIGRANEIERIIQILCRRTKNNPVLIGEPGVGKSAIIEGLAQQIVAGKVPDVLKGKKVFSLDMASVVAGTKYRGEFEERFKEALNFIKKSGNIILFIDEIHSIMNAGGAEGAIDASSILKPMLARGEIQTVGATTIDEYRKNIEKDAALERRFQPVVVDQPSVEDTIEILRGLKEKYETHHKVRINDDAIIAAATLSDRYISDRFLPDKAIDLIDEAASRKRIYAFSMPENLKELEEKIKIMDYEKSEAVKHENFKRAEEVKLEIEKLRKAFSAGKDKYEDSKSKVELEIGYEEIAEIVAKWTGVPVVKITESESERLLHLEDALRKKVIGQDIAVSAVSRAIKRARAGLQDPKRPIGSFIFLGPTGVGKTELSKALADAMFGDENLMIRVDMSEYMDKANVSKMIGSAPGYVGFEEGGQLTEKVRRKPYSVVLFDEIEKAHPDVFNLLLQILEDGRLTDSHGRTVNFKNTIIIMTSNIGSSDISKMGKLGFGDSSSEVDYEDMKKRQIEALKSAMRPEFINRIDEIVIFRKLDKSDMAQIAELMLNATTKRLKAKDIEISVSEKAKAFIVDKGFDNEYGARPLRRTIQRLIEDRLSEEILGGKLAIGDKILIDLKDNELTFEKQK